MKTAINDQKTLNQLLRLGTAQLADSSDTAHLDAKILLRYAAKLTSVELITESETLQSQSVVQDYQNLIHKRIGGTPIAYLVGQREFWSLNLKVTKDTLIPRPETELLVEAALARTEADSSAKLLDLGTGSGAIACAIACERPNMTIIACDQSSAALSIAKENAETNRLNNIEFLHSNWFSAIPNTVFDIIVSNPPYVDLHDPNLSLGDVRFEPQQALTPGIDGLSDLRKIIAQAGDFLKPGAALILEHGYNQMNSIHKLLASQGFVNISGEADLSAQPRISIGYKA